MEKEIKGTNLDRLEDVCGAMQLTKGLSNEICEKAQHGEGDACTLTRGEYDSIQTLALILFERLYAEYEELKNIIEEIYKEGKNNGKV